MKKQWKRNWNKRGLDTLMIGLLVLSMLVLSRNAAGYVMSRHVEMKKRVVVIDAGHGGNDPGKIGVNNALEKEINLIIAKELKKDLEAADIEVIMTREEDSGLYDADSKNKKAQDMKRRCALIDETKPSITVSIHQNSYHEEYVKGAQVFYYGQSDAGKKLAETIQEQLVQSLDKENSRKAKANESYYLLRKTEIPTVIVECGFLSNWEEAALLTDEHYQQKVAWAVHMGILKYLNANKTEK